VVKAILTDRVLPTQVGGGLRSAEEVGQLLRDGADSAVVGTRALEEPAWIAELAGEFPGRIVVAADVRGRSAVVDGWARPLEGDFLALVGELSRLPLGGMLVTAVHREGRMEGADLPLMAEVVRHTTVPVLAAGGIASLTELRALAAIGCAGAVLGMALYTGALEPRAVVEEFAA
jgi:phosphoribosylformimino-5-aminoimidazole carboxamide ribotide isomerase